MSFRNYILSDTDSKAGKSHVNINGLGENEMIKMMRVIHPMIFLPVDRG